MRLQDCKNELHKLLQEEVNFSENPHLEFSADNSVTFIVNFQRLAGATLLIFANKCDLPGSLSAQEIKDVSSA